MKLLFILAVCLSVAGCGWAGTNVALVKGYSANCIDGVKYLQFPSGVTVQLNQDGSVKRC